ncbi:MAG: hypothetical protein DWQ04_12395 [Chloroflexi bacterium]|nr:MAG: hypothetical protein DWQ04_12395 [Chloroflexota bacterium]
MIFTESVQDYLKIIFQLCNEHNKATTSQIANKLHLKPA